MDRHNQLGASGDNAKIQDLTPQVRTAFILGAGLGLRLRPLTLHCPKPLLPVEGRPLITYVMEHLYAAGSRRFIVNTHHCPEAYAHAFPRGRWRDAAVVLRHEPVLLDTGGGLKNIEDLLEESDTRLIVYNGDILTDLPLAILLAAHVAATPAAEVTLALRSTGPVCNVALAADGRVCDLRGRLGEPGERSCQFAGISVVERRFLARLTPGRCESLVEAWLRLIAEGNCAVRGVVIDTGQWHDVGTIAAYERLRKERFFRRDPPRPPLGGAAA